MRAGETIVIGIAMLLVGCGTSPAYRDHARVPEGGIRVVRGASSPCPSEVKGTCPCEDDVADDDDDEAQPRSKPVEYVKIREWQAPATVQQFEAENPPRGNVAPSYTEFPKLTLHSPVPGSSVWTSRRYTYSR